MALNVGTILTKAGLDIDTASFSQYTTLIEKAGSISEILTKAGIELDSGSFSEYTNKLDNIDAIEEVFTYAGLEIDQASFTEYTSDLDRIDASEDVTTLAGLEIDQASFSEYTSDLDRIDDSGDVTTQAGLEIDQSSFSEYEGRIDSIDSFNEVSTKAGLDIDQSSFTEYVSEVDQADKEEVLTDAGLDIDQSSFTQYKTELDDIDNRRPIETDARIIYDRESVRNFTSDIEAAQEKLEKFSTVTKAITGGIFATVPLMMGEIAASGLEISTGFEDASATLTTLYGDLDTAKEKFQWLSDFAASTPFEFPELMDATIKLKAYGIEAQDYMRVIGDTASAMGKTLDDTVEAVADAQTGEFERMKEFGIKAVQVVKGNVEQFAQYGASVGDTMLTYVDRSNKQMAVAIDRNNREMITSTITAIWNEKYAGAMETRSKTLTGMASTLKDNLSMAFADFLGFNVNGLDAMEVQTWSVMGALKELAAVAVDVTSYLTEIPEPIQTFLAVSALGVAAASALAGGYLLMSAAADVAAVSVTILGTTLTVVEWATGIGEVVAVVAALAAGLVYLDEKTGIVSDTLGGLASVISDIITIDIGFFSDLAEDIGTYIDEAEEKISGFVDWIKEEFGFEIPNPFAGLVNMIHEKAEVYRGEDVADDIASTGGTANPVNEAATNISTSAETTASNVDNTSKGLVNTVKGYADDLTSYVTGKNGEMEESAKKSAKGEQTAWEKAVEEMYGNSALMERSANAGITGSSIDLSGQLEKGIQGTGEVLGLNNDQELMIQKADGTIIKLNQLNATQDTVFKGLHKNYAIIIDDGSRSQEQIQDMQASYKSMGMESIVVQKQWGTLAATDFGQKISDFQMLDTNVGEMSQSTAFLNENLKMTNSGTFTDVNGNVLDLNNILKGSSLTADDLNKRLTATDGTSLSNVQGGVAATGANIDSATEKTSFWNWGLNTVDGTPFGNINNNVSTAGMLIDTSSTKTGSWHTTLGTLISSPFSTLTGNLGLAGLNVDTNTGKTGTWKTSLDTLIWSPFTTLTSNLGLTGTNTDINTGKTGGWNTALGTLIASPFTTLTGNLGIAGSDTDINTGKTGDWYGSLGTLIASPFDTLFENLISSDTLAGNAKTAVDNAIGSLTTFGGFTFSTTLSSLGSVYDTLGDIYNRAKDAVEELFKVGTSNSSSNKSASSSTTNSTVNNNNFTFKSYATESNVTQWVKRAVGK